MSKTSDLEAKWASKGGQKLRELYQSRKNRLQLSMKRLGSALNYRGKGQTTSIKSLIDGKKQFTPEQIKALADELSKHTPAQLDLDLKQSTQLEIESLLATYAGRQMPSLIQDLNDESLDDVLDTISRVTLLLHTLSTSQEDGKTLSHIARSLALKELNHVIKSWLEIHQLVQLIELEKDPDDNVDEFENSKYELLWSRWNKLDHLLTKQNMPIQTAYANVVWSRLLAWGGETQIAEVRAETAIRALSNVYEDNDTNLLNYYSNMISGDNKRVKGMIAPALIAYNRAKEYILNLENSDRLSQEILLKEFNTYLLASIHPPKGLVEQVRTISNTSPHLILQAKAFYALSWLERSRHGDGVISSAKYGEEGLRRAQMANYKRVMANGYQYLGDAFLQLGNFAKSREHLELSLKLISPSRSGRLGYSKLLLGLVHYYNTIRGCETRNWKDWQIESSKARQLFDEAYSSFRKAASYYNSGSGAYQLKRLLIEDSKWRTIEASVLFRADRSGSEQFEASTFYRQIEEARRKLDEARNLLWHASHDFHSESIQFQRVMIDFFEWLILSPDDPLNCAKLEEDITSSLKYLESLRLINHPDFPGDTYYIERDFWGLRAKLHAMRGVVRWKLGLEGSLSAEEEFEKSIMLSIKHDFLALLDCRLLTYLAIGPELQEVMFDNKLKLREKHLLNQFLRS